MKWEWGWGNEAICLLVIFGALLGSLVLFANLWDLVKYLFKKYEAREVAILRTFVERVYQECDEDIGCSELPVPGDLCLWTLRAEAKSLIDKWKTATPRCNNEEAEAAVKKFATAMSQTKFGANNSLNQPY